MNRLTLHCLFLLAWLPVQAATNLPPATEVLLDDKAIFDLTAELKQYEVRPKLSGKLTCAGSGLVTILIRRWAFEFDSLYPEVEFDIEGGGSVSSLPAFLEGKLDLMPMARPLLPDEIKALKARFGTEPHQIIVSQDAVGVYVNKNNPLPGLTLDQLDAIYSREARRGGGRPEFWRNLGVAGPLGEKRITRLSVSLAHGTYQLIRDQILLGADYRFDVHFEPVFSSLVQGVGADDSSIGLTSVMFGTRRTRLVTLQAADGSYVLPTYQNTVSRKYPLTREMRIVLRRKPDGSMNPVALEFLRFVVSRRGQRLSALAEGYPLTLTQQQEALKVIDAPATPSTQKASEPGS